MSTIRARAMPSRANTCTASSRISCCRRRLRSCLPDCSTTAHRRAASPATVAHPASSILPKSHLPSGALGHPTTARKKFEKISEYPLTSSAAALNPKKYRIWSGRRAGPGRNAMDWKTVLYEADGAIGTITLNRPEKLNAFSGQMLTDFASVLAHAEADEA